MVKVWSFLERWECSTTPTPGTPRLDVLLLQGPRAPPFTSSWSREGVTGDSGGLEPEVGLVPPDLVGMTPQRKWSLTSLPTFISRYSQEPIKSNSEL